MPIETSSFSRFTETEAIVRDGKENFGRWVRPDFLKPDLLAEEEIFTLFIDGAFAGRPDLIADDLYDSPFFEWVLIMFNKPKDTLGWPESGDTIKYPSRTVVLQNT